MLFKTSIIIFFDYNLFFFCTELGLWRVESWLRHIGFSLGHRLWSAGLAGPWHMGSQGFPGSVVLKTPPANAGNTGNAGDAVQSLGRDDPLEKEMATPSSVLAWEIPWTEEPGGLQSMGLCRIRHDSTHRYTCLCGILVS